MTARPKQKKSDLLQFLRSRKSNPEKVGAVMPSGDALARLITKEIDASHAPVIELGAGTGVFTKALIARGLDEGDLTLIDSGPNFLAMLRERFPRASVVEADAARLASHNLYPAGSVGAVVSGLPLLSMSPRKIMGVLTDSFHYLREDGAFYQFTYGPRCPVPKQIRERLGIESKRIGRTLRNLPPATVYRLTRRRPKDGGAG
ncbi:MAG TPA: methyltransferase domain-containing protein [Allosphingosinicella sp.]|nr:methyltransferase domain-containing protein [Allosphingosinicella sp.]